MPLATHISADVFLHIPPSLTEDRSPESRAFAGRETGIGQDDPLVGGKNLDLRSRRKHRLTVVFFITGNPGLIGYYHPFLSLLVRELGNRGRDNEVVVAGLSLGGFEVEGRSGRGKGHDEDGKQEDEEIGRLLYPTLPPRPRPSSSHARQRRDSDAKKQHDQDTDVHAREKIYTLREQVELNYTRIEYLVQSLRAGVRTLSSPEQGEANESQRRDEADQTEEPVRVILMGHSVGTYIALELVRLRHERHAPGLISHPSKVNRTAPDAKRNGPGWTVQACILLTPTIQDLHLSPSGRIATPLLAGLPFLPTLAHHLLHSFLLKLPTSWFAWLVFRATGAGQGSHGFDSTVAFLRSERGVKQALVMAGWELQEIRADQWGSEVWGAASIQQQGDEDEAEELGRWREGKKGSPKLFFWFAKQDHWVADLTKEEILRTRADGVAEKDHVRTAFDGIDEVCIEQGTDQPPTIRILETEGLAHAWCLKQSDFVARRVGRWLEEVLAGDG